MVANQKKDAGRKDINKELTHKVTSKGNGYTVYFVYI
jgi:hypothetical protein